MTVTKMLWNSDIKLLKRNNDNNTDIFCSKLSQNSNEEENFHGDTNILTRERYK